MGDRRTFAVYIGGQILGGLLFFGSVFLFLYLSRSQFPKLESHPTEAAILSAITFAFIQKFGVMCVQWLRLDRSEKSVRVFSELESQKLRDKLEFRERFHPIFAIVAVIA